MVSYLSALFQPMIVAFVLTTECGTNQFFDMPLDVTDISNIIDKSTLRYFNHLALLQSFCQFSD
jgi:hypothetical protein